MAVVDYGHLRTVSTRASVAKVNGSGVQWEGPEVGHGSSSPLAIAELRDLAVECAAPRLAEEQPAQAQCSFLGPFGRAQRSGQFGHQS